MLNQDVFDFGDSRIVRSDQVVDRVDCGGIARIIEQIDIVVGRNQCQFRSGLRAGGDLVIQRGDTLWSITSRVRPDSRLTINQTMLAIYEANPDAFAGNINVMSAGATLRIPSADDVFRISRGDALAEVQRQNTALGIRSVGRIHD